MMPAPPATPAGMVATAAPNLGRKARAIAVRPATQYAAVEYTRELAMTPMFSAYVVVPTPPPRPEKVVERPSAIRARPVSGSRSRLVIRPTVLTWPMFSAISTSTTGRNSGSTWRLNSGAWNGGRPTQAASPTAVKSTWPWASASTYPARMPTRMDSRPTRPRNSTAVSTTASAVPKVVRGTSCMAAVVAPARFRPISATMVPITAGGMRAWIQPVPDRCTTTPIAASSSPVAMMPPSAAPVPSSAVAAVSGAMNANELPR